MLNLIIFGTPGAGKGTQAKVIAQEFNLTHLSSGELLRHEIEKGELSEEIRNFVDRGELVPDSLVIAMVENAISKGLNGNGFIFDGYPRNLHQAETLKKFFVANNIKLDAVLNLKLNEDEAVNRILLRGKTSGRSDDVLNTITSRLQIYHKQTEPLLNFYDQRGLIIPIDGSPAIETVSQDLIKIIKEIKKDI